jgi:L-asparaginase II
LAGVYRGGEPLATVIRSGFAESFHRGSVVVVGADGETVDSRGDVASPIFPRSANKPLQAVGMLRTGLRLDDPAYLALVCASHQGEPRHVERIRAMLASAGLDESVLGIPPDYPLSEAARDAVIRAGGGRAPILMNCSGKHVGMLLTCVANGWPLEDYRAPEHPLQLALRKAVEELVGESAAAVGVDGCGAPVWAVSLTALARGFLRLADAAEGTAERRVADAMRAHPELVSGDSGPDTRLMRGMPGLLAKGGAEGVLAAAVPGVGAVTLKIDDGSMRACAPVLVSGLRRLGLGAQVMNELAGTLVLGGGKPVGAVRSDWLGTGNAT